MKCKKRPKIRFKGFNDDWEQRKLGEIVIETIDNRGKNPPYYCDSGIPIIDNFMIKNNGYPDLSNATRYLDEYLLKNFIRQYNEVDDVLITLVGNGIGNIALFPRKSSVIIQNTIGLRFRNDKKFKYYSLLSKNNIIVKLDRGMAQPSIRQDELKDIMIEIPNLSEQKKISTLFTNLDNLITLHQEKHDKLIEIKKSLLEKMFPKNNEKIPEIRFKGFSNDWKQYKLDDFGKSTGGVSIESEFSDNGKYKVISIGSYSETSIYNDQGIRCKLSNRTKDKVLNKDDITMILNDKTSSGNIIGRVLLIDKSGEYVYNQRTERIEINKKEYDPLFIYELLNAPNVRRKIINESQGNTQIYVNWTKIKELLYYIPDIKEQEKLGKYFKNMDNLINLHQNKLNKLKKLKESLLRKMFI